MTCLCPQVGVSNSCRSIFLGRTGLLGTCQLPRITASGCPIAVPLRHCHRRYYLGVSSLEFCPWSFVLGVSSLEFRLWSKFWAVSVTAAFQEQWTVVEDLQEQPLRGTILAFCCCHFSSRQRYQGNPDLFNKTASEALG